jgi:hypothetical protein
VAFVRHETEPLPIVTTEGSRYERGSADRSWGLVNVPTSHIVELGRQ